MARIWIEFETDDSDGAARWGNVSSVDVDCILDFAESILGNPDTVA